MAKITRDTLWGFLAPITPLAPLLHVLTSRQSLGRVIGHMWADRRSRYAVLALAASSSISVLLAQDRPVAFLTSIVLFLYILLVCYGIWGIKDPRRYLNALVLGGGFLGFVVVTARLLKLDVSIFGFPVLTAFQGLPGRGNVLGMGDNGLAAMMEPAAIGAFALLLYGRDRRFPIAVAGAFALAGIFVTFSRGSILALAVTTFIFAATQVRALKRQWKPIAFLAVIVVALIFLIPSLADRIISIASIEENIQRIRIWTGTWHMVMDHPLFGSGPGNFGEVYPTYQLPEEWENARSPHNLYLYILSGWGLVGFAIFFGFLASIVIRSATRQAAQHTMIALAMAAPFWIHVLFNDLFMVHVPIILGCAANRALFAASDSAMKEAASSGDNSPGDNV